MRPALLALPKALLIAALLVACAPNHARRIEQWVGSAQPGERVCLTQLTDFEWQSVALFGPYTQRESVERTLGLAWPGYDRTGLQSSDMFSLLVFVRDQQVVRHLAVDRCKPDFATEAQQRLFDADQACFVLTDQRGCHTLVASPHDPSLERMSTGRAPDPPR
jgi:hypothetical protein